MTDNSIRTEKAISTQTCRRQEQDAGGRKMSIFPYQVNEVVNLYSRVSKINPSSIIEKEKEDP